MLLHCQASVIVNEAPVSQTMEEDVISPPVAVKGTAGCPLTIRSRELGRCRTRPTGFWSSPFPACSSSLACASCKSASVPSRTARPAGTHTGSRASRQSAPSTFTPRVAVPRLFPNLVVQVPGLIVFLCALPAVEGLVIDLYELPLGAVTKMAKKAVGKSRNEVELEKKKSMKQK